MKLGSTSPAYISEICDVGFLQSASLVCHASALKISSSCKHSVQDEVCVSHKHNDAHLLCLILKQLEVIEEAGRGLMFEWTNAHTDWVFLN